MKNMTDLNDLLTRFPRAAILVAGDMMLDRFVHGDVNRLSPEAPVPVLTITGETHMPGGAGNVVANLSALGVRVHVAALTGDDRAGAQLREMLAELKIDTAGLVADDTRPTTQKTRYLSGPQQMMRADIEKTHAVSGAPESKLIARIESVIQGVQAVVMSDYGKGTLSPAVIAAIFAQAKKHSVPVIVDPKGSDYTKYKGALLVTPNRKELGEAAGLSGLKDDEDIVAAARGVLNDSGIQNMLVTRSEDGMTLIHGKKQDALHIRTTAKDVFDVSGAGDTVVAVMAACIAAGADMDVAARLSNIAGGIAVGKVGTAPVRGDELSAALSTPADNSFIAPVWDTPSAAAQIKKWQAQGLTVGFTNGCFDILHYGHVNYLAGARGKCDRLVVGLNHDASVKILKGPTRPVNAQGARAAVMAALSSVDGVVFFGAEKPGQDNTPCAIIDALRPDIFFKGGDYKIDDLPESKIVTAYGGRVCIMDMYDGYSTTSTIAKMKNDQAA